MAANNQDWQTLGKAKLESINESLPQDWRVQSLPSNEQQRDVTGDFIRQYLSKDEIEITEASATTIVERSSSGQWTAEANAKWLDEHCAHHGQPIGPLHGLPVSLKDQFHVKGVETTMGYIGWIGTFEGKKGTGKEKVFESELVKELRDLGAIPYCKTSVPHTLMSGETINNIIGYTWNPKNRNLSSGGSSGGEGALIGLRGSPLGFGTDIGGSIRIPAAFNGLYGLRPSSGRLPYEGMANSMDGQNSVLSVVGPLADSIATLRLVVKSLLSRNPWLHDPLVHEIPWREDQLKISQDSPLSFGIFHHDGVVSLHPPVRRAVETVAKILEKQGHKVIDWEPPSHKRGADIIMAAWTYDNGADVRSAFALSGEPMSQQIANTYGGDLSTKPPKDAAFIAANNVTKREYQKEYMEYWNSTAKLTGTGKPVDVVISPLAPFSAARPGTYSYYAYSSIVNVLDYTACTLPVTTADKNIDIVNPSFKPMSKADETIMSCYDPEIYDGSHVSVQLIGRRLQEEKVLAITEYVAGVLKG
ncbi:MAG: hypothetical protein L6R41_000827 [Letrouitia leprolyta]|nr:MAG: hypothetical protein L6R41_000827 [Letrouitia leprolyta]